MRDFLRSIRVRLTLWYVLSLALLLVLISGGVYFALRSALRENLDDSVESRFEVLRRVVQVEDRQPRLPINTSLIEPSDNDDDDDDNDDSEIEWDDEEFVRLYDASGALLLDTGDSDDIGPLSQTRLVSALDGDDQWFRMDGDDEAFRVRVEPIRDDEGIVGVLAVGESEEEIEETLGALLNIFTITTPAALLAIAAVGMFLSHRALSPIDRITRTTRDITAEDLSRRLDLDLPDDELGRLAHTLNSMLERLDLAFQQQRQFTADASHELRTPLSIMKGQIEVALSRERSAGDYRDTLEITAQQADRLISLVTSLLTLSRADAGEIPIEPERVELRALAEMTTAQLDSLAEERGVEIDTSGPDVTIVADTTLMIQLLLNLLDNAIRHTPPGGRISVEWATDSDQVRLVVRDTGEGIAPEHLPHIFDRFYRVDRARSREAGGAGIGLSISQWIVRAHGGSIEVESAPDRGTAFTVRFPRSILV